MNQAIMTPERYRLRTHDHVQYEAVQLTESVVNEHMSDGRALPPLVLMEHRSSPFALDPCLDTINGHIPLHAGDWILYRNSYDAIICRAKDFPVFFVPVGANA